MLALLLIWLLIAALALPAGWWLLSRFDASGSVIGIGDRAFAAIWLGLCALCAAYAALSLMTALNVVNGLVLCVALLALLWWQPLVRREARAFYQALRAHGALLGAAMLAGLAVAAHATQAISAYDAGLYHYQHIQWLADHGVVRGLGLIHTRFGFAGTWFALPAAFNHGLLRGRVLTLGGGLVILLAVVQWLMCVQRCRQSRSQDADRFLVIAFGLLLLYVIDKGWFNAASPDAPVFVLTILIAWLMLQTPRGANGLALILALATLGFKLSALPLLLVAAWHVRPQQWRHAWWVALPLGALLALQSFISNGCLAYPIAQSCLPVDWGVGALAATRDAAAVLQWARWSGAPPAAGAEVQAGAGWLTSWVPAHDVEIALFAIALLVSAVRWQRLRIVPGAGSVASLAALGVAFGMISAPDVRFWGGSLFALLGLAGAAAWPASPVPQRPASSAPEPANSAQRGPWFTVSLIAALIVLTLTGLAHKPLTVLLRPPQLTSPALTLIRNASGVSYWLPTSGDQCWNAPLPCTPARLPDEVRYRNAAAGPGYGFTRALPQP